MDGQFICDILFTTERRGLTGENIPVVPNNLYFGEEGWRCVGRKTTTHQEEPSHGLRSHSIYTLRRLFRWKLPTSMSQAYMVSGQATPTSDRKHYDVALFSGYPVVRQTHDMLVV
ncbi:hypothetical protein DL546_009781 [Coniochaeta pulveracea]|uniref:Uncharacterized protein n=1 Tax=Coniochaeta pulveracea TaxID=177199 RepID=A0A420YN24_9PEZI|nr:hypothetical protein DL546_009781 [Coniochaeta pulveracea]